MGTSSLSTSSRYNIDYHYPLFHAVPLSSWTRSPYYDYHDGDEQFDNYTTIIDLYDDDMAVWFACYDFGVGLLEGNEVAAAETHAGAEA
jgi:hypothetical protein